MIADVLLEWLVAQHKPESSVRIHIDCLLQIQFIKGNHLLFRFHPVFLSDDEMKLVVDDPVVRDVETGSIFQEKLWIVRPFFAVDIHGSLGRRRKKRVRGIP
ncbi:MAG: hypothetical protein WA485_03815 [Candidatus Sulfotelmatobacter sp.]